VRFLRDDGGLAHNSAQRGAKQSGRRTALQSQQILGREARVHPTYGNALDGLLPRLLAPSPGRL